MESQEGFIQNAATVLSYTPTHGVRKVVIRLKTPMRKNCVSKKFLYEHMLLHTDKDRKTFIKSLDTHNVDKIDENHSHEPKVVDLRRYDFGEVDEEVKEAAKILVLMSRDHQLKSKTSMAIQREEEAAKCLMCLDDPVSPPVTERNLQVEESADTISGEIKGVRDFDLNELCLHLKILV
nr:hypothetical protein [Tanacetum cinerariifolium]